MQRMPAGITPILLVVAVLSSTPTSVAGQGGHWTETSTLGYGAAGFGLTLWACWSCDYEAILLILGGGVAGSVIGYKIGGAAEGAARRGEPLTAGQLWGARFGTVTGIAALGTGLSALIIDGTEGNEEGDDERLLVTLTLLGAGLGVLVEALTETGVPDQASTALQSLVVQRGDSGALRIGVRHAVRW